jgi:hypothetical protein
MTLPSKNTLEFARALMSEHNARPLGALLFRHPEYLSDGNTFNVYLTATQIGIDKAGEFVPFIIDYVGLSTKDVASQLSNSPYPVEVIALADIPSIENSELLVSGAEIPVGFHALDRWPDGKGAIVRCKRWSASFDKLSSMSVRAPYAEESTLPWWPRIEYGKFTQRENGIRYTFDIPEYHNQAWSPTHGFPFKDVEGEPITFLNSRKIKLDRKPVLSKKGSIIFSSGKNSAILNDSIIKDIDSINGIIYLKDSISLPKDSFISYTYLEKHLIYKHLNINGHFSQNPYILDKYVVIYALPVKSAGGVNRSRGIYHSTGDSIKEAINNISNASTNEPIAVLGAMTVRPVLSKKDISIVDTRVYGGGLIEDAGDSIDESKYFYDIGTIDGIPYPGAAAVAITLPSYLKEILPVEEIQQRATKFMAAGIYPVLDFDTELINESDYAADISLLTKTPVISATALTGWAGFSGTARDWIDYNRTIPADLNNTYTATDLLPGPIFSGERIVAQPGTRYYQIYLRSTANPIFRYEERTPSSDWTTKTFIDERDFLTGTLAVGRLDIDATHSYKEIRNIEGSALFSLENASGYYDKIATDIAEYNLDLGSLGVTGDYSFITGYVGNVFSTEILPLDTGSYSLDIDPAYAVLMDNYSGLSTNGYLDEYSHVHGSLRFFYDRIGAGGAGGNWPRNYDGITFGDPSTGYRAFEDVYHVANYTRQRMNEQAASLGASSIAGDTLCMTGQSGTFQVGISALNLIETSDTSITGVYQPYIFNATGNTAIDVATGVGFGEIESDNKTHLGLGYIKAAAAMYATQDRPTTSDYSDTLSIVSAVVPRDIALSGIAKATLHFTGFYTNPTSGTVALPDTWVTDYNRTSAWANEYLSTVTSAFDNIYYGNTEWAGYTGISKLGTRYAEAGSDAEFSYDLGWGDTHTWPDTTSATVTSYIDTLVTDIETNFNTIGDRIISQAGRGGILPDGYIDAVKHFLWLPKHQVEDTYPFTGGVSSGLIDVFEAGMAAVIKGSLSEDGILTEAGSYKHMPAPFTSTLPTSLLEACMDAVGYYDSTSNATMKNKWTALYQGIYNTSLGLYEQAGGFPYDTNYTLTNASGDPGSALLGGLVQYIVRNTGEYGTGIAGSVISGATTRY